MLQTIEIYFLIFLIYSVLGWCLEVMCKIFEYKRFVNRGFLIGPYCPIYGSGALLITIFLQRFSTNSILLFIMAILVCGTLEYLTSYIMEKVFSARWWDYSQRKFNINGRICLETIIPFGILGCFIIYISNPFFMGILQNLNAKVLNYISITLATIYLIDYVISTTIISEFKSATNKVNKENITDNTEEITKKVKAILENKSFLHKRLFNAYPRLQAIKRKIKKIKENIEVVKTEIKDNINEIKTDLSENLTDMKENLNQKIKDIKQVTIENKESFRKKK